MMRPPKIVVVGSINMDLVVRCGTLPLAGQTVAAHSVNEVCGGKGANQAVAARKCGAQAQMIGRVGSDAFADRLMSNLDQQTVDHTRVWTTSDCSSGLAIVAVEDSGQNAITLIAGANGRVSVSDVQQNANIIESADTLLLQLEIPTPTVLAAIRIAKTAGVRCIVDPAPVASDWNDELLGVDLVCPNESEAEVITGVPIETLADAQKAAAILQSRGAKNVAITMGDRGTLLGHGNTFHHFEAACVNAVDTTAAGDAFAGALATRWAETDDLTEAVKFANLAGAIAATRHGAQPSLATRQEIEDLRSTQ
ncbi:MAG: ribokinase [Planctomycetota bacterium]